MITRRITLDNGKYAIDLSDTGLMTFYRNGEPWPGGQEAFQFAKLVGSLAHRVADLEAALIHQYNEEWDVGDGITDEAKVQYLIDRIPK